MFNNEDMDTLELRSKSNVNYQQILLFHISRISWLSCYIPKIYLDPQRNMRIEDIKIVSSESLLLATNLLESFLKPYVDETYKEEVKKIKIRDKDSEWKIKKHCTEKIAILMKLMARRNLLLEERKEVEI